MNFSTPIKVAATVALFSTLVAACDSVDKPDQPLGLGYELEVDPPQVTQPLPVIEHADSNADGTLRRNVNENAVAFALSGINDIWQGTSDEYQSASSGDGPSEYFLEPIIDAAVWRENMAYVIEVTQQRSDEQGLLAFLDDTRSKNYSVIDGYGPLTEAYVAASGAYTDIPVPSVAQVLEDAHYQPQWNDDIRFAGDQNADLGEVVALVDAFRQRAPASTSGPKYIFSTPRPWRMTDAGDVDFLGTAPYRCVDSDGQQQRPLIDRYTTSVSVLPGLMCARRNHSEGHHDKGLYSAETENRRKDGGFPSGHTNAGYLAAMAYAYALPQRYTEMLTRASELGESRIMAGMHSPLDVMGGRIQATMVAAYALHQDDIAAQAQSAYQAAQSYFGERADAQGLSLYQYAHQPVVAEAGMVDGDRVRVDVYNNNRYQDHQAAKALYRARLTYGFSQDPSRAGQAPVVPMGAEALLQSRLPYLSDAQRRAVLYTTAIDSGYPLLDQTYGWGRLDLVTAADGYGDFLGDVAVTMDANAGGFNRRDWWRNDIGGPGLLTKAGSGELILTGNNAYQGGTLVQAGRLVAASPTALGQGDLYVSGGTAVIASQGSLTLNGNLTLDGAALELVIDGDARQADIDQRLVIDGGQLVLDFAAGVPQAGARLTLLTASEVDGEFDQVDAGEVDIELSYTDTAVVATIL